MSLTINGKKVSSITELTASTPLVLSEDITPILSIPEATNSVDEQAPST